MVTSMITLCCCVAMVTSMITLCCCVAMATSMITLCCCVAGIAQAPYNIRPKTTPPTNEVCISDAELIELLRERQLRQQLQGGHVPPHHPLPPAHQTLPDQQIPLKRGPIGGETKGPIADTPPIPEYQDPIPEYPGPIPEYPGPIPDPFIGPIPSSEGNGDHTINSLLYSLDLINSTLTSYIAEVLSLQGQVEQVYGNLEQLRGNLGNMCYISGNCNIPTGEGTNKNDN